MKKRREQKKGLALDAETTRLLEGVSEAPTKAQFRGTGLRTDKRRHRHDETRVPRGHRRAPDDWPVQLQNAAGDEPTEEDRALFKNVAEAMTIALFAGVTDEMRKGLRVAFRAVAGHEYGEHCTAWLALLIRQGVQATVAARIQARRVAPLVKVAGRIEPPTTGGAIADHLRQMAREHQRRSGAPCPDWLDDERLPVAIDAAAEQANLGGAGGRGGGKTPERLAQIIVENLRKKRAANSRR